MTMIPKSTTRSPASGRRGTRGARRRGAAPAAPPGARVEIVVVLAGLGRAVAEADARAVELEEPARQPAVHAGRDLGVDERPARLRSAALASTSETSRTGATGTPRAWPSAAIASFVMPANSAAYSACSSADASSRAGIVS